jgi:hypothetical protein
MSSNKPNDEKEERYFFGLKKDFYTINENGTSHKFLWPKTKSDSMKALRYFRGRKTVEGQITDASPGIYTWLLKGEKFYTIKVASKQEIGTLHSNLYDFATLDGNEGEVIAAGELEIQQEQNVMNVRFNFLSGTYHERFEKVRSEVELIKIVTKKLESIGVSNIEYIGKTPLIDGSNIRANKYNMEALTAYFKKEGGKRRTKRNKTKKRHLKNKKW